MMAGLWDGAENPLTAYLSNNLNRFQHFRALFKDFIETFRQENSQQTLADGKFKFL
ncbi:MAG: hypothetical protein R2865_14100 [Deinococcales bacterium]